LNKTTLEFVAKAVGGEIVAGADICITGVSIDSRGELGGKLFVPFKGARADGHDFIEAAFSAGAAAALTERIDTKAPPNAGLIRVKSAAEALKSLAATYLATLDVRVVGITGSAGKTTTKDMTAAVLSKRYCTLKTEGNFNNEIGLPLTVFRLNDTHRYAVIEMGMNHLGEIDRLSKIVRPDIAIITNIGMAHVENLGSREGILQAKTEIFNHLRGGGVAVLNRDDDMLRGIFHKLERLACFGLNRPEKGSLLDVWAAEIEAEGLGATRCTVYIRDESGKEKSFVIKISIPGSHMVENALAAVAVGHLAGLSTEEIQAGIEEFTPTKMRMDISEHNNMTIINDAYNASPDSMLAALDTLAKARGRRVAVLGVMAELGEYSENLHIDVARRAVACADVVVLVGRAFMVGYEAAAAANNIYYFKSQEDMLEQLQGLLEPGDVLLIKAARALGFERTVKVLRGENDG